MDSFFRHLLFLLPPEHAHDLAKISAKWAPTSLLKPFTQVCSKALEARIGNTVLSNPIGLAAGFDKNGEALSLIESLGFGFAELGSVTWYPCVGNEKPRLFRLQKDQSLINRLGLPNWGAQKIFEHLSKRKSIFPLGINIARTPDFALPHKKGNGMTEMLETFRLLYPCASYLVFNLSCPNTPDGRSFEDPGPFLELAREICLQRKKYKIKTPVLVKLSPDLKDKAIEPLVKIVFDSHLDGFVVSNTTLDRPKELLSSAGQIKKAGEGGLSGRALAIKANALLEKIYEKTGKNKLLIGVGGILTFRDLIEKLRLGAALFQVYTGLVYGGPLFVGHLNKKLNALCKQLGVKNYLELQGNHDILKR